MPRSRSARRCFSPQHKKGEEPKLLPFSLQRYELVAQRFAQTTGTPDLVYVEDDAGKITL